MHVCRQYYLSKTNLLGAYVEGAILFGQALREQDILKNIKRKKSFIRIQNIYVLFLLYH